MSLFQRRFLDVSEVPQLRFPTVPHDHPDLTIIRIAYDLRGVAMAVDQKLSYTGPSIYFSVLATSLPALHRALETISHDSGGGAGHQAYRVPAEYEERCREANEALRDLEGWDAVPAPADSDFETICIGEHEAMERIAGRSYELGRAHELLGLFFDGFPEEGR